MQAQAGAARLNAQRNAEIKPKPQQPAAAAAAAKTGVSEASIERVMQVKREDPAVFADLESGKLPSVNAAVEAVKAKKQPLQRDTMNGVAMPPVKVASKALGDMRALSTHLTDAELDEIIEYLCDVRTGRDTGVNASA